MKKISLNADTPTTLADCFESYITRCTVRNLSEKTIALYRVHFSVLQKYLDNGGLPALEVSPEMVDGFILY